MVQNSANLPPILLCRLIGLVEEFRSALDQHPDGMSDAVAAIKVLLETIKRSEGMRLMATCANLGHC